MRGSGFIEIGEELLAGAVNSHLRAAYGLPHARAAALLECRQRVADGPWEVLCGYSNNGEEFSRQVSEYGVPESEPGLNVQTREVNVLGRAAHRLVVVLGDNAASANLVEICTLLGQQLSSVLELSFVLHRYQQIVSGLSYQDLLGMMVHELKNFTVFVSGSLSRLEGDFVGKFGRQGSERIRDARRHSELVSEMLSSLNQFLFIHHGARPVEDIAERAKRAAALLGRRFCPVCPAD